MDPFVLSCIGVISFCILLGIGWLLWKIWKRPRSATVTVRRAWFAWLNFTIVMSALLLTCAAVGVALIILGSDYLRTLGAGLILATFLAFAVWWIFRQIKKKRAAGHTATHTTHDSHDEGHGSHGKWTISSMFTFGEVVTFLFVALIVTLICVTPFRDWAISKIS